MEATDHVEHRERSLPTWWQAALLSLVQAGALMVGVYLATAGLVDEASPLHWAVVSVTVGGATLLGIRLSRFLAMKLGVVQPDLPGLAWAVLILALAVVGAVLLLVLDSLPPAAGLAFFLAGLVTIETVAVMTVGRAPDRPDHLETEAPGS